MDDVKNEGESLKDFINSFSYGSRNDLNFKFLPKLSEKDGGKFIRDLLWLLGDTMNDGDVNRIVEHVIRGQIEGYKKSGGYAYEEAPFTPLKKPLAQCTTTLITSSGHFVKDDDPKPFGRENLTQEEAIDLIDEFLKKAPELSAIPVDTAIEDLRVRHGGYDIRGAQKDHNSAFPLEIMRKIQREQGTLKLADEAYSFVGACSQVRLQKESAPHWLEQLRKKNIDTVLLVPV